LFHHNRHNDLSDEQMLRFYRETGDNQWLGALLQRYTVLLLGVANKYLKDREMAEDAVQHVFETTLTRLPDGPIANFKGWLYVLMRNHCLQQLRSQNHMMGDEVIATIADDADSVAEALWKEQTLEQMAEALGEIAEEQRTTISLFYLKKYSYEQIIETTGFTFMQVKSYIQNGKRNLKNILLKKLRNSEK